MKARILFIMHMPPPVHGASTVGKYIHDSGLVNSEFDCYYLNPTTARDLEDVRKFRLGKILDVFHLLRTIEAKVNEINPDLVYFTANACGLPFYKDYLIARLLKKLGCRVVIHYHNKGVKTRQDGFLDNVLYKDFFKGIKVILLADSLYSDIQKYVDKKDVYICPNGIPQNADVRPSTLSNAQDPLHILYLSNMMKSKGVMDLIEACKELKERGINFSCDFVGGWKDINSTEFQNMVQQHGLQDNVKAFGPKYGEQKNPFWQQADVFVFPSCNETFGLVLVEAMEQSIACVGTMEGGIPSIIENGKTGFLVPKHASGAIADALEKIAKDRELCKRMGEAGRQRFLQKFTLDKFEEKITGILQDCTNNW